MVLSRPLACIAFRNEPVTTSFRVKTLIAPDKRQLRTATLGRARKCDATGHLPGFAGADRVSREIRRDRKTNSRRED